MVGAYGKNKKKIKYESIYNLSVLRDYLEINI